MVGKLRLELVEDSRSGIDNEYNSVGSRTN